jgi:hypothetical protein
MISDYAGPNDSDSVFAQIPHCLIDAGRVYHTMGLRGFVTTNLTGSRSKSHIIGQALGLRR